MTYLVVLPFFSLFYAVYGKKARAKIHKFGLVQLEFGQVAAIVIQLFKSFVEDKKKNAQIGREWKSKEKSLYYFFFSFKAYQFLDARFLIFIWVMLSLFSLFTALARACITFSIISVLVH